MTSIKPFVDMCDWELKNGSHPWPGPGGGTCINEAAIVAAGFEYKSIRTASDCPPCFSYVISAYLIGLNDALNHTQRQKLMRFVTRLSGSADTPEIEQARLDYIVIETIRRVLAMTLDAAGFADDAASCRAVSTPHDASLVTAIAFGHTNAAAGAAKARYRETCHAVRAAYNAAFSAQGGRPSYGAAYAIQAASHAVKATCSAKAVRAAVKPDGAAQAVIIYDHCIAIVEGALAIGKQATDIDAALVVERMNSIRISEAALAG